MKRTVLIFIIIFLALTSCDFNKGNTTEIVIAVAGPGPFEGDGTSIGMAFNNAAEMYLDLFNEENKASGLRIRYECFDDKNDPELAADVAGVISKRNDIVGVIGHNFSSCSKSAGEVYKANSMPAISPSSTSVDLCKNNPWYFRTIFDDNLQGEFLGTYAARILKYKTASIIVADHQYGKNLAGAFEKTFELNSSKVTEKHIFSSDTDDFEKNIRAYGDKIKSEKERSLVFISSYAAAGGRVVKILKDMGIENEIMGTDSFDSDNFLNSFNDVRDNQRRPEGFYTDGLYVTSPMLFDMEGQESQAFRKGYEIRYDKPPEWTAAFAYDSIKILCQAIIKSGVSGKPDQIREDRRKVRNWLADMQTIEKNVSGVTGINIFDKYGNSLQSPFMGIYKNRQIVPAHTQIYLSNKGAKPEACLSLLNGGLTWCKTSAVYTGIRIDEISNFDTHKMTCDLGFYFWFRYTGDIKPEAVEFLNANEKVEIREIPVIEEPGSLKYNLYYAEGNFNIDDIGGSKFRQHTISVSFRNKDVANRDLVYVMDMGAAMENRKLLKGWHIRNLLPYQDTYERKVFGNPEYHKKDQKKFSRFTAGIVVQKQVISLRGIEIPSYIGNMLMLFVVLMAGFSSIASKIKFKFFTEKKLWVMDAVSLTLFLLVIENMILNRLLTGAEPYLVSGVVHIFDILWWVGTAVLASRAVNSFFLQPVEKNTGRKIPKIVYRFITFVICVFALFGILAFVYEQKITSLLATSGVFAMIIGLAIQMNISNIFSGIALNLDRPFRIGDWVKIGDHEGIVSDVTWRATELKNLDNCVESIPNSVVEGSHIMNYNYPDDIVRVLLTVHVNPVHPPEYVQKILMDAVLSVDDESVLKYPVPYIEFGRLKDWAADYDLYFFIKDYENKTGIADKVWKRIWMHFKSSGVTSAIKHHEVHMHKGVKTQNQMGMDYRGKLLNETGLFNAFSKEVISDIETTMTKYQYTSGDQVSVSKKSDVSVFLISEGAVKIWLTENGSQSAEIARMGAGEFYDSKKLFETYKERVNVVAIQDTVIFEMTEEYSDTFRMQQMKQSA